jgi:hypothetical protein
MSPHSHLPELTLRPHTVRSNNPPMALPIDEAPQSFKSIHQTVLQAAVSCQGDCLALLSLLRTLEGLHQHIRETAFRDALPENRQLLYSLLKDIEVNGGWPYIQRMKLSNFLEKLEALPDD